MKDTSLSISTAVKQKSINYHSTQPYWLKLENDPIYSFQKDHGEILQTILSATRVRDELARGVGGSEGQAFKLLSWDIFNFSNCYLRIF